MTKPQPKDDPGKYDDKLTRVMEETMADTGILIIINGDKGHGFSMQSIDPEAPAKVSSVLRQVADEIDKGGFTTTTTIKT